MSSTLDLSDQLTKQAVRAIVDLDGAALAGLLAPDVEIDFPACSSLGGRYHGADRAAELIAGLRYAAAGFTSTLVGVFNGIVFEFVEGKDISVRREASDGPQQTMLLFVDTHPDDADPSMQTTRSTNFMVENGKLVKIAFSSGYLAPGNLGVLGPVPATPRTEPYRGVLDLEDTGIVVDVEDFYQNYARTLMSGDDAGAVQFYHDDVVVRMPGRNRYSGLVRGRDDVLAAIEDVHQVINTRTVKLGGRFLGPTGYALILEERVTGDQEADSYIRSHVYRMHIDKVGSIDVLGGHGSNPAWSSTYF
jgi:ketosteroid isomerase-like protein